MLRRALQNLLLFVVSLMVTLLVLELGVRVVGRTAPGRAAGPGTAAVADSSMAADSTGTTDTGGRRRPHYVASDLLGWHLQPDTVQVFRRPGLFDTTVRSNELGFRGAPIGPRRPGLRRIGILGDSYAFGWGVEEKETYGARIEDRLNAAAAAGVEYEVLNGALPGFGTYQRLRALDLLLPHGLDAIVIEFSVSNDVVDDWRTEAYLPDELGRYHVEGTRFPAFELWLDRHSRLFALARRRLMPLRLWFECRRSANMERTRALWAVLVDRCRAAGLEPIVLLNPSRSQVLAGGEGIVGVLARTDYSFRPNRLCHEIAAEHGLELVDGLALFDVPVPQELFIGGDAHWNPEGHERVAAALVPLVEERLSERPAAADES